MTCQTIETELVAYHFGTVSLATRLSVERHLVDCSNCLRSFLELKRLIETEEGESEPSGASRDRLRLAVAEQLHLQTPRSRPWRWWERPFAFGLAGVAVAASLVVLHVAATVPGSAPRAVAPQTQRP